MRGKASFSWFRLLMAVMIGYFGYVGIQQHIHICNIDEQQQVVSAKLLEAKQLNEDLKEEKSRLQETSYVEKVAREELGLVKPGEMPYISSPGE